MNKRKLKSDK